MITFMCSVEKAFPGSSRLVRGEVPRGSWLLIGSPGSGKTVFSRQFLCNGLMNGEPCILIETDIPPEEVREDMKMFGVDLSLYERRDLFRLIDCYTWRIGGRESSATYFVTQPSNLGEISIKLEDARRGLKNVRFVLDSASTLALEAGPEQTYRFLQVVTARMKDINAMGLIILASGVHHQNFENSLKTLLDGILELKIEEIEGELKRFFRIFSMRGVEHSTIWIPFEITGRGIVIE